MVDRVENRAAPTSTSNTAESPRDAAVDAGEFGHWVRQMSASLRGDTGSDVPCGDCVGCCSSSWPIALRARDAAVTARIPAQWLLEPEDAPPGLRYLGFRPDGTCPMLESGRCSVYADRPQTCRDFDCRIFAAAGIASAGDNKPLINARIVQWRFSYATASEKTLHEAMRQVATFLVEPETRRIAPRLPTSPIALAGLAFKAHRVFLDPAHSQWTTEACLQRVIAAARAFDEEFQP